MQPSALPIAPDAFRATCAAAANWDEYFELSKLVRAWPEEEQWSLLWAVLFAFTDEQSDRIAGYLLIDIEPKPRQPLQEILAVLSKSRWYLSNREVPFYLAACFGKYPVLSAIESALAPEDLPASERLLLEGVRYWVRHPVSCLSDRLHYFEWQAAIEAGNG
jgi:hypothetical protein